MKKKLSPEDLKLWKNQLKDVKPLSKEEKGLKEPPSLKKYTIPPLRHRRPHPLETSSSVSPSSLPLQELRRKEVRHLKIEGRLDMHGMTLDEGYAALERYLHYAQGKGFKIILVITGKGSLGSENTLRHQVPRWIKETALRHLVSSFQTPAKQQDGGQGACYIGVRKRKITR